MKIKTPLIYTLWGLILGGCTGLVMSSPAECPPSTRGLIAWETTGLEKTEALKAYVNKGRPTKKDFLEGRGEPAEIVTSSETEETWVYKDDVWCGFWVGYIGIAPLMLPVCKAVDYVTFENEKAIRVKTTGKKYIGGMGILGHGDFVNDDTCSEEENYTKHIGKEQPLSEEEDTIVDSKMGIIRTLRGRVLMTVPGEIGGVVTVIDSRTTLTPLRESKNWVEVETPNGDVGWIRKANLLDASNQ